MRGGGFKNDGGCLECFHISTKALSNSNGLRECGRGGSDDCGLWGEFRIVVRKEGALTIRIDSRRLRRSSSYFASIGSMGIRTSMARSFGG